MKKQTEKNTIINSVIIFLLCFAVRVIEVLVIRTDETFFAECFVNKVFGIILLYFVLKFFTWHWKDIGFVKHKMLNNIFKGFGLCFACYTVAFIMELIILYTQGIPAHIEFYVTGFSLVGDIEKHTGIGFVLMCIGLNIINVWMEEGLFRGFYITYINIKHSPKTALYIAALLFGLWHIVMPFRSFLNGEISMAAFMTMGIGYVILSAMMGVKWGLLFQLSGSVWIGVADHFFNNCIVTNLLHVVTNGGVDDLQVIRVLIGEIISFVIVIIYAKLKKEKAIYYCLLSCRTDINFY